ncbi:hypothetical protein ACTXJ5_06650 [Psychrobacter alimentarius]|uniref:hypothetical protein n=1 Tax=Psychrobacter alimentarius TaxID=261164 RepID=UPI003FD4DEA5
MFTTIFDMFELSSVFNGVLGAAVFAGIAIILKNVQTLPIVFKNYQKLSRHKELIKVKNNRHDNRNFLYELQKVQNWFIVFVLSSILNFLWLLNNNILESSIWLFLILMTPSFILEFIWLNKLSYIEDLRIYQKGSLEWKKRRQRKNKRRVFKLKN